MNVALCDVKRKQKCQNYDYAIRYDSELGSKMNNVRHKRVANIKRLLVR